MEKIINPDRRVWNDLLTRPELKAQDLSMVVNEVFEEVQKKGDEALLKYTSFFDKVKLDSLKVNNAETKDAIDKVDNQLKDAIKLAASNIEAFHKAQISTEVKVETVEGVTCWQASKPIEKVGLYIPGGSAPLFSTVLMLAIPAKLAGCKEISLCTPPNEDGSIADEILFAADLVGVTNVYKVGGIQAIAGLTYGTESINKVYKIFGPGNQYVTAAKQKAFGCGVAIDMPAGPSELMVVADESANAAFVASDLLSQAEHGADSQVMCVVNNEQLANDIIKEVNDQLSKLSRKEIAEKALLNSKILVIESRENTVEIINEYGPEHLILCVNEEDYFLNRIVNSGSVFIGNYTPESAGDYASGTNHTLPTNGFSKAFSGVNMDAFVKKITYQKITENGIKNIGEAIELMAEAEQLDAHKNAVTLRLNQLSEVL